MHNFGEVVTLVRNGVELKALVLNSRVIGEEEHLSVAYPNMGVKGQMLSAGVVAKAMQTAFDVKPLTEGGINGWTEQLTAKANPPSEIPANGFVIAFDDVLALSKRVIEYAPDLNVSPDGTIQSAAIVIDRLAEYKERAVQAEVQLAGCGVAALGWSKDEQLAKPGDYEYSASYQDVLDLRKKYEDLLQASKSTTEAIPDDKILVSKDTVDTLVEKADIPVIDLTKVKSEVSPSPAGAGEVSKPATESAAMKAYREARQKDAEPDVATQLDAAGPAPSEPETPQA